MATSFKAQNIKHNKAYLVSYTNCRTSTRVLQLQPTSSARQPNPQDRARRQSLYRSRVHPRAVGSRRSRRLTSTLRGRRIGPPGGLWALHRARTGLLLPSQNVLALPTPRLIWLAPESSPLLKRCEVRLDTRSLKALRSFTIGEDIGDITADIATSIKEALEKMAEVCMKKYDPPLASCLLSLFPCSLLLDLSTWPLALFLPDLFGL